jgi:hypothetical protein
MSSWLQNSQPAPGKRGSYGLFLLGSLFIGVVVGLIPLAFDPGAYYLDDAQDYYTPTMRAIGEGLRHGSWTPLTLQVQTGGALLGEYQYALLNPVSLLAYVLASFTGDPQTFATALIVGFYAVLASGTFAFASACGAARSQALVVAAAFAANNFLFYITAEAGHGIFISTAYLTWALAFLVLSTKGPWCWLGCVAGAYLTLTAGWPQADVLLMLAGLVVFFGVWRRSGFRVALAPASALLLGAICAAPAWIPVADLLATAQRSSGIYNRGVLEPNFYDLLSVSNPIMLGHWLFSSYDRIHAPVFFAGWYLVPLAPFLDWRALRSNPMILTLLAGAGLIFCATQGPENLSLLRWPVRMLPYAHLFLLTSFAIALSVSQAIVTRKRLLACFALCVVIGLQALQRAPDLVLPVVFFALLLAVLGYAFARASVSPRLTSWVLLGGVFAILLATHAMIPRNSDLYDWRPPEVNATARDLASIPQAYSLNLVVWSPDYKERGVGAPIGNMPLAWGEPTVLGYSPIGHAGFNGRFCVNSLGLTCPGALARFSAASPVVGMTWLDLLKVDRVLLRRPADLSFAVPRGWRIAQQTSAVTILSRADPRHAWPGSVSYASPNLTLAAVRGSTATSERVEVSSTGGGEGSIVFARLPWRGYRVTLGARALEPRALGDALLAVTIPRGASGTLAVGFSPPGSLAAAWLALAALISALAGAVGWSRFFGDVRPQAAAAPSVDQAVAHRASGASASPSRGVV